MRYTYLSCGAIIIALAAEALAYAENHPMMTLPLVDKSAISTARDKISQHDPVYQKASDALIVRADKWLQTAPPSVMDKRRVAPSGDKHDYMSLATYWYVNPDTADGMPWIRRDGQRNPLTMSNEFDRSAMSRSTSAIMDLSLAYQLTRDEKYAQQCARMIRTWFLDPATRMNPHLEYGQAIPGINNGRCIGIIDTAAWALMLDTVELLQDSPAWTQTDHQALQKWFGDYLRWLTDSKLGQEEESQKNNHGTWYDVQVARFALFANRPDVAMRMIEKAKTHRIPEQIEPDGRMPHELARTKAFTYSTFNLRAFFYLARMGDRVGIDLWQHSTSDGRTLKKALDFLAPYADPSARWPYEQIGDEDYRATLQPLLRMAASAYGQHPYAEWSLRLAEQEKEPDLTLFTNAANR